MVKVKVKLICLYLDLSVVCPAKLDKLCSHCYQISLSQIKAKHCFFFNLLLLYYAMPIIKHTLSFLVV